MRKVLAALRALPRSLLWDACALAGASAVVVGVGMVYAPAAWVVAGLGLLSLGVLGARKCS